MPCMLNVCLKTKCRLNVYQMGENGEGFVQISTPRLQLVKQDTYQSLYQN